MHNGIINTIRFALVQRIYHKYSAHYSIPSGSIYISEFADQGCLPTVAYYQQQYFFEMVPGHVWTTKPLNVLRLGFFSENDRREWFRER